jgi:hypothetical protein
VILAGLSNRNFIKAFLEYPSSQVSRPRGLQGYRPSPVSATAKYAIGKRRLFLLPYEGQHQRQESIGFYRQR